MCFNTCERGFAGNAQSAPDMSVESDMVVVKGDLAECPSWSVSGVGVYAIVSTRFDCL